MIKTFYVARNTNIYVFSRHQLLMLVLWISFLVCPSFHLSLHPGWEHLTSSPFTTHKGCCSWGALCASTLSSDQGRRKWREVQIRKHYVWRKTLNKSQKSKSIWIDHPSTSQGAYAHLRQCLNQRMLEVLLRWSFLREGIKLSRIY